ncbi:MAG: M4 family metallopeptidase [Acidobacteria bacterium]|nr:M4 family metallopeptidase [Acidobacteriota bacterium]
MATRTRLSLSTLSALLVAAPAIAAIPQMAPDQLAQVRAQEGPRAEASVAHAMAMRTQLGLDNDASLRNAAVRTDEFGQTHTHVQQMYRGVRVWGGDAIIHMDKNGAFRPMTSALKAGINMNTMPSLRADEALETAHQDLAPKGAYASNPTSELVVFPIMQQVHVRAGNDATAYEYQPVRYALAYHVHTDLQNGVGETKQMDYMIDAHTGAILKKWSTLETAAAVGTGKSQYSGTVSINTNSTTSGYELRDMTRGTGGTFGNNVVTNLNHATSGNGTIYSNSTNTWGDGANYVEGSSTTAANGQTAAVDAAYGIQATWDMYKNVLGRNGIDGAGKASYLRVHYSNSYDNAFWDDTCFCMTFGDGSQFTTLTSVDVAGHEMSHGVCANDGTGGLNYSGESGGLNESNSDCMGTMVEFYDLGGGEAAGSTTIPATGGNWTIGEQLSSTPLRYMYKPSLDGSSPDAWSSSIGSLDVHYSSGPGNRMFYFLSQGATTSGNTSTTYLPSGMTGVGNDHAARIHYRALTTYYNSSETYAQARTAHISAATDLYGANSPEVAAVENAFHGINVGAAASGTPNTVTASITTPSGNVTIASGTSQSFVGTGTDSSSSATLTYAWTFGDGGTASTASASHTYTNSGSSNVTYTATLKVTDNTGVSSTATRTITVQPAATGSNTVTASITTPSSNVTIATGTSQSFAGTGTDSASGQTLTYTWNFGDGTTGSGASTSHTYTNSGSSNVTYTATLTAKDTTGATGTATRTITVTPASTGGGTEQIKNGGFESGATSWTETSGVIGVNGPSEPAHGGTYDAWLDGYGSTHTDYVYQTITVPASGATLTFYLHVDTDETTTTTAYDKFTVLVQNTSGTTLKTLATFSNLNAGSGYTLHSYDLSAYKGQTIRLKFNGSEDSSLQTSFVLDDVSVK